MEDLRVKQDNLKSIQAKLQALVDDLEANKSKKQELEEQVSLCKTKLLRAKQLLGGLGG